MFKRLNDLTSTEIKRYCEFEANHFDWPWTLAQWTSFSTSSRDIVLFDQYIDEKLSCIALIEITQPDFVHLYKIVTASDFRRQGQARKVFAEIDSFCLLQLETKSYKTFLEVQKTNFEAIKFYESLEFDKLRIHKSFYKDGSDALLMERVQH